jgi:hypothetical protein
VLASLLGDMSHLPSSSRPRWPAHTASAIAASGLGLLLAAPAAAQPLTFSLAGGSENWPAWARDAVMRSMTEAVDSYNRCGVFEKHLTANYNAGVPTAQASSSGWIDFGGSTNTRVALHEIAHALGTGTTIAMNGGSWAEDSAPGRRVKLFDGRGAVLSTGGSHFWPYGLNYDNEDNLAARDRQCKLVAAFRLDAGIVIDSDKDGLPDDWERFYFANLTADGKGDADADGISNLDEYASDSDPKQACPVLDGRTYVIRGQITKRALAVAGASRAEGAATEQRDADGSTAQQWTARYVGGGFWHFESALSGKVLEVPGSDTTSGLSIRQAAENGALKQAWRVAGGPGAATGHFQIANHETGRVVDGLDGAQGAAVQQWPLLGNLPQQYWSFEEVPQSDAGTSDAGTSDAGTRSSGPDAGAAPDAGASANTPVGARDAGGADAAMGSPTVDAGSVWSPDVVVEPSEDGLSGCSTSPRRGAPLGPSALLIGLLGAAFVRRRVRRRAR